MKRQVSKKGVVPEYHVYLNRSQRFGDWPQSHSFAGLAG